MDYNIAEKAYPSISVITVSYNAIKTIEETILSVLNQAEANIEYIIIDGGSTDGTIDIIKKYEDKISYWKSEPDKGIYDAMNKGIAVAKGNYIHFLGADDVFITANIINKIQKTFTQQYDIISAPVLGVDEQTKMQKMINNNIHIEEILMGNMLPHQGVFAKKQIMKEYLFDIKYKYIADYDFICKCVINKKRFHYINEPIVYFSLNGCSDQNRSKVSKEFEEIINFYGGDRVAVTRAKNKSSIFKGVYFWIKRLMKKLFPFLFKKILLFKGWEKHSCSNINCRWCSYDNNGDVNNDKTNNINSDI